MIEKLKSRLKGGTLAGNAVRIYVFQFTALAIGLVSSLIIARILGPEQKGIFDLFALLIGFILNIGLLGFGSGLLYYLANRNEPLKKVHGVCIAFSIVAGLAAIFIGVAGFKLWGHLLPNLPTWMTLSAFLLAPFFFYNLIWTNIMTGINQAPVPYKIILLLNVIKLAAVLLLLGYGNLNVDTVVILGIVSIVLTSLLEFIVIRRLFEFKIEFDYKLLMKSLKYGLVVYISFVVNILHFKIDQVMINYWLGSESVGVYAVSVRWAEMLFFLDAGLILGSLHKISSLNTEESYSLTKRLFRIQFLISLGAGLLLLFLAHPIVHKLYGLPYAGAVLPMMILLPGVVTWSAGKVLTTHLVYNRKLAFLTSVIALVGLVINVVLNYYLIRSPMGISGAALASMISYALVVAAIGVVFLMIRVKDRQAGQAE